MIASTEEVARSLTGAWDFLHRRTGGVRRFDFSARGFFHSFWSLPVAAPAFIGAVAAERAERGLLVQGAGLFDDPDPIFAAAVLFAAGWLILPVLAWCVTGLLGLRGRMPAFIIACNWSNVIGAIFLAAPSILYALGWATDALAWFYGLAFLLVAAEMRWFMARVTLGVSSGVAAVLIGAEVVCGLTLRLAVG